MRHGPDRRREAVDALRVQRIEDARSGLRAVIAATAETLAARLRRARLAAATARRGDHAALPVGALAC